METEFKKFGLNDGDFLVIKVNANGLTEEELKQRVFLTRNDEFVKFIEDKGHKVFVTYSGIDMSILRMEEKDKLVVYVDLTSFKSEEEEQKYLDFIKFKLEGFFTEEKLIIIPTKGNVNLAIKKEETNNES